MTDDKLALTTQELAQRIANFSGTQYKYLAQRLRCGATEPKTQSLETIGVSRASLDRWRWNSPEFKALDDAIEAGDFALRSQLAVAILTDQSPQSALNICDIANVQASTDRQLQAKLQANVKVLEAVGILKQGNGIAVNIDNRRIDSVAIAAWQQRKAIKETKDVTEANEVQD